MPKHRSISERLARAKSPEARASVLADWVADWEESQWYLLEQIEAALRTGNHNAGCIAAGAFKNQIEQRFDGLETVLRILQEPQPVRGSIVNSASNKTVSVKDIHLPRQT